MKKKDKLREEFEKEFTFGGVVGVVAMKTDNAYKVWQFIEKALQAEREIVMKEAGTRNIAICHRCLGLYKAKHENCPKQK